MKIKDIENVFILGIYLAVVSAIAASTLAIVYKKTKPAIDLAKVKAASGEMVKILPEFNNNPTEEKIVEKSIIDKSKIKFYPAKLDKKLVGIVAESIVAGYKGDVTVLISLGYPKVEIKTIIITNHTETPGIGTKVVGRVAKKNLSYLWKKASKKDSKAAKGSTPKYNDFNMPYNKFLDSKIWTELSLDDGSAWNVQSEWKVKKDGGEITEITGATISSRAVTKAVYAALATFKKNEKEIIAKLKAEKKNKKEVMSKNNAKK